MLRPLLAGLTILAVGQLGEREDGLTAALIVLVAFTVYMILSIIFRPQRNRPREQPPQDLFIGIGGSTCSA